MNGVVYCNGRDAIRKDNCGWWINEPKDIQTGTIERKRYCLTSWDHREEVFLLPWEFLE